MTFPQEHISSLTNRTLLWEEGFHGYCEMDACLRLFHKHSELDTRDHRVLHKNSEVQVV